MVEICQQVSRHKKLKQQNPNTEGNGQLLCPAAATERMLVLGRQKLPTPGKKGHLREGAPCRQCSALMAFTAQAGVVSGRLLWQPQRVFLSREGKS